LSWTGNRSVTGRQHGTGTEAGTTTAVSAERRRSFEDALETISQRHGNPPRRNQSSRLNDAPATIPARQPVTKENQNQWQPQKHHPNLK